MNNDKKCYQKKPSIISKVIGEETVLVPIRNNTANLEEIFILSETAGRIWEHIDGKKCIEEIKKIITKEFNVGLQEAQADIISFFKQLKKEGCIGMVEPKKKIHKNIKRSIGDV